MILAFLDEFGHLGPYFGRSHPKHNTSPVFGIAGILLPEQSVRPFASFFLQRKAELLTTEIVRSGRRPYQWEKKGANLFTANSIEKYPNIRATMFRILNRLKSCGGRVIYVGREKIKNQDDNLNPNGLYKTVFAETIRQIDAYADGLGQNFILVVGEHSARKELLETAAKTMYGAQPTRRLLSPPFEVESYLNQTIQSADWVASIVGRLWNYKLDQVDFQAYAPYEKYFWDRLHAVATHSTVLRRPKPIVRRAEKIGTFGERLIAAQVSTTSIIVESTILQNSTEIHPISTKEDT